MELIRKICPMCGKINDMAFNEEQLEAYTRYTFGIGYIQDIPATPSEREFLNTGYCLKCQQILFAPPSWVDEESEDEEYEGD